jgi:glycosyltransferase involved in cell wall biosynthesis
MQERPPNSTTQRISVMHLIHSMAYGGIETAVINWLRKVDRTRFDVSLVGFANAGNTEAPFVNSAIRAGLQVKTIPWHRGKPLLKSSRRLAKLMREHKVDILHTHNCYADCVGAIASRLKPAKTIATVYVWADYDWKRNMIQAIDRVVLRWFDRVTAHCEDTQRKSGKLGRFAGGVDTLICGLEARRVTMPEQERQDRRRELGAADDEIVLGNVARLYPEKAHDSLLRRFKVVASRNPKAKLWISGIGPLEGAIRSQCSALGLDDRVKFLGFVEDLARMLRLLDIQVHPSHIEGVPLALCEGMAAGLPVVASAVGGIPEILDHGASGVLVQPGDEEGFANAVSHLIDNPRERSRLGLAARHFMETEYSLNTAVSRVEETYYEMMRS